MDQNNTVILLVMMLILSSIIGVVAWGFSTNWWSPDEEGTSGSPGPSKAPGQVPSPLGTPGQVPVPRGTPGQVPVPRGTPGQVPVPRGTPGQVPSYSQFQNSQLNISLVNITIRSVQIRVLSSYGIESSRNIDVQINTLNRLDSIVRTAVEFSSLDNLVLTPNYPFTPGIEYELVLSAFQMQQVRYRFNIQNTPIQVNNIQGNTYGYRFTIGSITTDRYITFIDNNTYLFVDTTYNPGGVSGNYTITNNNLINVNLPDYISLRWFPDDTLQHSTLGGEVWRRMSPPPSTTPPPIQSFSLVNKTYYSQDLIWYITFNTSTDCTLFFYDRPVPESLSGRYSINGRYINFSIPGGVLGSTFVYDYSNDSIVSNTLIWTRVTTPF